MSVTRVEYRGIDANGQECPNDQGKIPKSKGRNHENSHIAEHANKGFLKSKIQLSGSPLIL